MISSTSVKVLLRGIKPIMFDAYRGKQESAKTAVEDKLYLDGTKICLPTDALYSFLDSQHSRSCCKMFSERGQGEDNAYACEAFLSFRPHPLIPFTRKDKPILLGKFGDKSKRDETSGCVIDFRAARTNGAAGIRNIPQDKYRPVLPTPWELAFEILVTPHEDAKFLARLKEFFMRGGYRIGLGTFRPRYGGFVVERWE